MTVSDKSAQDQCLPQRRIMISAAHPRLVPGISWLCGAHVNQAFLVGLVRMPVMMANAAMAH